jgi:hypothetical protein
MHRNTSSKPPGGGSAVTHQVPRTINGHVPNAQVVSGSFAGEYVYASPADNNGKASATTHDNAAPLTFSRGELQYLNKKQRDRLLADILSSATINDRT